MTTWRVPEDLKTELSKLVPNPYPSLSAAVVALCRKGLQVPDPVGGFNPYFYVPMMTDLTGSRWTTPKYTRPPGVPLCDLEIGGLRFDGGTRYDAPGNFGVMTRIFSLVVEGGSHNLVKEDTPLSWCKEGGNTEERYRDLSVEPGLWKWGETVVLTLSTQHLYPQDHFYLRVRIAGGAT
jgi:hypothetical protein